VPWFRREGGRILLYRRQKSSTVLKVYTCFRDAPYVSLDFCDGLSNHRVHVCSSGWLSLLLIVPAAIASPLLPAASACSTAAVAIYLPPLTDEHG